MFITPSKFENVVKQQKAAFHNTKLEQAIRDPDLTDEQRLKILSQVFEKMTKLTYEQTLGAISKVVFTDDEGELVQDKISEVNSKGIEKTMVAKCSHCENTWEATIEFNPVNFF